MREGFLVILVDSQVCQSWCHEILVTAPEIWERFLLSRDKRVFCWTRLCQRSVIFCVLLIVLCLWCFPSHGTGPREGPFNQQERWTNYWWWFQNKQFIEVPKLSTHLAQSQGYLVLWLGSQVNIVQGLLVTRSLVTVYLSPVWVLAQCCLLTLVFSI